MVKRKNVPSHITVSESDEGDQYDDSAEEVEISVSMSNSNMVSKKSQNSTAHDLEEEKVGDSVKYTKKFKPKRENNKA